MEVIRRDYTYYMTLFSHPKKTTDPHSGAILSLQTQRSSALAIAPPRAERITNFRGQLMRIVMLYAYSVRIEILP